MVIDEKGKTYGRLKVLEMVKGTNGAKWLCRCSCGRLVTVIGHQLRNGHTKSCGCLHRDITREICSKRGIFSKRVKAMEHFNRLRSVFHSMRQRCYNEHNPEYAYYGGKGVVICKEWQEKPDLFILWALDNGYEEGLTIDRIDNSDGYSPDNCRFISRAEQNRNTTRNNIVVDGRGNKYTTAQVAKRLGLSRSTTAKWFRVEGLRTVADFEKRYKKVKVPS